MCCCGFSNTCHPHRSRICTKSSEMVRTLYVMCLQPYPQKQWRRPCATRTSVISIRSCSVSPSRLPVGEPVDEGCLQNMPQKREYQGQFVTLSPVDAKSDAHELYDCSHQTEEKESLWTYMGYGPFPDEYAMGEWLLENAESSDPLFFTVHQKGPDRRVGMVSFLNLVPDMRRLELGHIWYGPEAQRTKVNSEAVYLMLCEAFDRLGCRRVEWKCDALNERSRAAAI